MGSPVSLVIANLVMGDLEMKALSSFFCPPKLFHRLVNDSLAALKKFCIPLFYDQLNKQNPRTQFTVERYGVDGIVFLDTWNAATTVYRKTTHPGQYLQFSSHNSIQHNDAVVRALYHRAIQISRDDKKEGWENVVYLTR